MLMHRLSLIFACTLAGCLMAADGTPVEAPKATPAPGAATAKPNAAEPPSLSAVPEEEKWVFDPPAGRVDAFQDIEARLIIEADLQSTPANVGKGPAPAPLDNGQEKVDQAIEWGAKEAERVESMILVRKWDETIQACDNAVKNLDKYKSNAPVAELIERFKRYRTQAEEAKIYEEAQAKFDDLGLKIEGILWSPEGSLAVISGEPRALKINDRAKDCVIINIDTNRVDFLFHYNRRRFEFQRYVGEVAHTTRAR